MRDFINRLKHLNSQCKPHEQFRDDQLLDRLINGMKHTELYNSLVTRGITTWDDTVVAVIELEDNLEIREATSTPSETASVHPAFSGYCPIHGVDGSCLHPKTILCKCTPTV